MANWDERFPQSTSRNQKEGKDMWLWIWLVVAVLAAIGEAVTYDLFLASVAVAALIVAATVGFIAWPLQISAFAALSLIGIYFIRPAAKVALGIANASQGETGVRHSHVVGRRAVVTQTVTEDGGQIRIGQGEFWSARAYEPTDEIGLGEPVRVLVVDGVTALVEPITSASILEENNSAQLLN
jgi:membrane protein implicated in regulation of membrane protease activity